MREIIFRGKRVDNGEWVEGDLIQYYNGVCKISTTIPNIPKEYTYKQVHDRLNNELFKAKII